MSILKSITNDFPDRPVVDATSPMLVRVSTRDLEQGTRQDPRSCALSWACYRSAEVEEAIIYRMVAYIVRADYIERYFLSAPAAAEVEGFDRHGTFELGEYRLGAPPPSGRLGYRTDRTEKSKKRGPHTSSHRGPRRQKRGVRTYSA